MEYRRVRSVLVLVLAVAALGAAGAAIDGGAAGGGSPGVGEGEGAGFGDGEESGIVPLFGGGTEISGSDWFQPLFGAVFLVAFVGAAVALVVVLSRWNVRQLLRAAAAAAVFLVLAVAVGIAARWLSEQLSDLFGSSGNPGGLGGEGGVGIGGADSGAALDLPLVAVAALLGVALLGALLLARLANSTPDEEPSSDPAAGPEVDPESLAPTGSTPTRRAETTDRPADNEVYRAWLALADAAGANPARDSPGTVVRRAEAADVDGDAAREITTLFEEVRYGGAQPTDERERRARSALERLGGARE